MTPEQAAVHKKLMETLPVRTHHPQDDVIPLRVWGQGYKKGIHPKKRRPVVAYGKRYASLVEAAKAIGKSRQRVYQLVMKGQDCFYVKE